MDGEDEILVLVFDEVLSVGDGVLEIDFSGALNQHLKGLYKWYLFIWLIFSKIVDKIEVYVKINGTCPSIWLLRKSVKRMKK